MRLRRALTAVGLIAFVASTVSAQTLVVDPATPRFTDLVIVRPIVRASFDALVLEYLNLRTALEEGLPARRVTDNPAENIAIQQTLARRIRRARDGALRGDIFTPAISAEFRRILLLEMTPGTLTAILDDNPGHFTHRINDTYPNGKPRSIVPGTFLAVLPALPDGIEYRFLGHHLILHDTRANVILDRLSCAIECIEVVD